jgi:hypothetical protein
MQKKTLGFIVALILALCAWSPWITKDNAFSLAETQFNNAWSGIIDGCGTSGNGLGAKGFRKSLFGATVTLAYQCGLVMPDESPLQTEVFVSFLGIAFGYPAP